MCQDREKQRKNISGLTLNRILLSLLSNFISEYKCIQYVPMKIITLNLLCQLEKGFCVYLMQHLYITRISFSKLIRWPFNAYNRDFDVKALKV